MAYFTLSSVNVNMTQEELNDRAFYAKLSKIGLKVKSDDLEGLICHYPGGVSEDIAREEFVNLYWDYFHPGVARI